MNIRCFQGYVLKKKWEEGGVVVWRKRGKVYKKML